MALPSPGRVSHRENILLADRATSQLTILAAFEMSLIRLRLCWGDMPSTHGAVAQSFLLGTLPRADTWVISGTQGRVCG
jgi:hypothetical protein